MSDHSMEHSLMETWPPNRAMPFEQSLNALEDLSLSSLRTLGTIVKKHFQSGGRTDHYADLTIPLPGLSTPVWMQSSRVNPLGVCLSLNFWYRSGVSTLAMWLLWAFRSGYSSSGLYFIFRRLWLFEKGMSDPTAVTRGERWEAYHGGLGSLRTARGNAGHLRGHLGSRSTRAFHIFAATPPSTSTKKEGRKKVLHLHQPCPVPTTPAAGAEVLPAPGAPPGWGDAPKVARSGRCSAGRLRPRLWGRGGGRAAASRGVLGPAGTPGRPAGERGGTAAPSVRGRTSSRRWKARGSRGATAPSASADPQLLPDRGGEGSIQQALTQQTTPSGDLDGVSICNYPAKYRVNLVLEPNQPGEHLRRSPQPPPRLRPCPAPAPPQPDRLHPTQRGKKKKRGGGKGKAKRKTLRSFVLRLQNGSAAPGLTAGFAATGTISTLLRALHYPSPSEAPPAPPRVFYIECKPASHWPLFIAHSFHWAARRWAGQPLRRWLGPRLPPFCSASGRSVGGRGSPPGRARGAETGPALSGTTSVGQESASYATGQGEPSHTNTANSRLHTFANTLVEDSNTGLVKRHPKIRVM